MQVRLHALGIGAGARRDIIDAVARCAKSAGTSTLWAGEHVVMVAGPPDEASDVQAWMRTVTEGWIADA